VSADRAPSPEAVIDIRGEPCGMPVLRVEKFLRENAARAPFTVLGDHEQTMDQLQMLALRYGWTCDVRRDPDGSWRASFRAG
jgi:TusA-related sulfurtransferase